MRWIFNFSDAVDAVVVVVVCFFFFISFLVFNGLDAIAIAFAFKYCRSGASATRLVFKCQCHGYSQLHRCTSVNAPLAFIYGRVAPAHTPASPVYRKTENFDRNYSFGMKGKAELALRLHFYYFQFSFLMCAMYSVVGTRRCMSAWIRAGSSVVERSARAHSPHIASVGAQCVCVRDCSRLCVASCALCMRCYWWRSHGVYILAVAVSRYVHIEFVLQYARKWKQCGRCSNIQFGHEWLSLFSRKIDLRCWCHCHCHCHWRRRISSKWNRSKLHIHIRR